MEKKSRKFFSKFKNVRPDPIEKSQSPADGDPVQDDWPGDGEDLAPDPEDLSFFFIFDGGSGYGVGKSGDGDQSACAAPFGEAGVDADAGEEDAEEDEEEGGPAAALLRRDAFCRAGVVDQLPGDADEAAEKERFDHIDPDVVPGRFLPDVFLVFLFLFQLLYLIHDKSISLEKQGDSVRRAAAPSAVRLPFSDSIRRREGDYADDRGKVSESFPRLFTPV